MRWTLWTEGNMTAGKFESKWQNMPDRSRHGGGADPGPEKDIEEDQLQAGAGAGAEAAPGAQRDPGETAEAKAARGDPNQVPKVVQGSEAKRKEDTAEAKVVPDQNPEKRNPEKAALNLNPNPDRGLRKKRTPELRVGLSRERPADPSPSQDPDRENSEVYKWI